MHSIYGVTCLQVYSYYVDGCSGDSKALKVFVAILMCVCQYALSSLLTREGSGQLTRYIWHSSRTLCIGISSRTSATTHNSSSSYGAFPDHQYPFSIHKAQEYGCGSRGRLSSYRFSARVNAIYPASHMMLTRIFQILCLAYIYACVQCS
jgi:hypothetical protein